MRGGRRFSQAISEGDGISLLADVTSREAAVGAEADGAEAIVLRGVVAGASEVTELPILWWRDPGAAPGDALRAGADAYVLAVDDHDGDEGALERGFAGATELGVECVVAVRNEDELRIALDRLDPEVFLLSAAGGADDALEHVLSLLPDVPAGKLAIADVEPRDRDDVDELERAGIDAVIVGAAQVADLLGPPAPEV